MGVDGCGDEKGDYIGIYVGRRESSDGHGECEI